MSQAKFDVLGLGTVAVDDLILVAEYPPADAKVRVQRTERQAGGLTAIALMTAARLGGRCAYAGVLGRDDLSRFAIGEMKTERIDVKHLRLRDNAPPVHSFIVIDPVHHTRNVFSHRAVPYALGAAWPPREVILSARVLYVDHADLDGMIRAARIARDAGIDVVADLERISGPQFRELIPLCNHLILPAKLATELTGATKPRDVVKRLWTGSHNCVAVTFGKRGCWFLESSNPSRVQHQPIFPVEVVDTTGCGDAFHGAYAWALAKQLPVGERMRMATAVAALQATQLGAQAGLPTLREVRKFLRERA